MKNIYFSSHHHKNSPSSSTTSSTFPSPLRASPTPSTPLYTFSESMMEENLNLAEEMIQKWNPNTSTYANFTSLFYENRKEAKEFLKCVKDLQKLMRFLVSENSNSEKLIRAQTLMKIAMKRLEKEFYQIMLTNREHLDPESISVRSSHTSDISRSSTSDFEDEVRWEDESQNLPAISEVEKVSTIAMNDLKSIAECMISAGYGKECLKVYKTTRKSFVDEGLYRLEVEYLSSHQIHKMDWKALELKINNWMNAMKIAVKSIFLSERILSDHVFSISDSIREACFSEICKDGGIILFHFPELVSKSKRSSEKMFRVLGLYNTISELWPDIESIFGFESTSAVRTQALTSLVRLGESVRVILSDFESEIQKESSKSIVHGGGIHPLTRHVMNYTRLLADYTGILSEIMADWTLPTQSSQAELHFENLDFADNPMSVRFAWLILVLLCKLDVKSEHYKDASLSYLFLANNLHYIISEVRTSNLQFILGDDWISNHDSKVKQYAANYERMGWSKVLATLPENPTDMISIQEANNCFKAFNSAFETAHRTQSSWVVTDSKLGDEIKLSICSKLVEAYRPVYEKYGAVLREENCFDSLVRFAPDDLSNYLSDLFSGTGVPDSSFQSSLLSAKHSTHWWQHYW